MFVFSSPCIFLTPELPETSTHFTNTFTFKNPPSMIYLHSSQATSCRAGLHLLLFEQLSRVVDSYCLGKILTESRDKRIVRSKRSQI